MKRPWNRAFIRNSIFIYYGVIYVWIIIFCKTATRLKWAFLPSPASCCFKNRFSLMAIIWWLVNRYIFVCITNNLADRFADFYDALVEKLSLFFCVSHIENFNAWFKYHVFMHTQKSSSLCMMENVEDNRFGQWQCFLRLHLNERLAI